MTGLAGLRRSPRTDANWGRVVDSQQQVEFNIEAHDRVTRKYERLHDEIFNPIEQERLRRVLTTAVEAIRTGSKPPRALDLGCGSGNLTHHLLELGTEVVSADVSVGFLQLIEKKFSQTGRSETLELNGTDLSNIGSEQFDLVATYSVLHHIPDYIKIVEEMCRILRPGGVIYIDHEVVESYYNRTVEYVEFLRKARPKINLGRYFRYLVDVRGYVHLFRRLMNPRYKREGDIHVWPDDHIEWCEIEQCLAKNGFETVLKEDYLLYKSRYNIDVYNEYRDKCVDERSLVARKGTQSL